MTKLGTKKGFTLIELMIVVAIIGILAAIAIPQFAQLISKSQEGATKGNLGTLRSALSIYYGDTEGRYPGDTTSLTSLTAASKYLQTIPVANLPHTTNSPGHGAVATIVNVNLPTALEAANPGGWAYDNALTDGSWGNLLVNCSHNDLRSVNWSTY